MNKRKAFLINKTKPHLALSDEFDVRESAVKLVASGLAGAERVELQVWVGRPDLGEWVTLYRRGEQVQLTATSTTHVELVPGRYRVSSASKTSYAVWMEDLESHKPLMTYEKGRQQSRTTGLIADNDYGGITVTNDGADIFVTDGDYGSVQVSGSGQSWTVTGDNVAEPVTAVESTAGVLTLDCALGDYFTVTLDEDVTSIVFTHLPAAGFAQTIMVQITQDAVTPRTVAWPASFRWEGGVDGVVSNTVGKVDLLALTTFDQGTTWHATLSNDRSA